MTVSSSMVILTLIQDSILSSQSVLLPSISSWKRRKQIPQLQVPGMAHHCQQPPSEQRLD